MSHIDTLIQNCHIAKAAIPAKVIEVDDLSALDGMQKAIYIIEEVGGKPEETFQAFSRYKANKGKCSIDPTFK